MPRFLCACTCVSVAPFCSFARLLPCRLHSFWCPAHSCWVPRRLVAGSLVLALFQDSLLDACRGGLCVFHPMVWHGGEAAGGRVYAVRSTSPSSGSAALARMGTPGGSRALRACMGWHRGCTGELFARSAPTRHRASRATKPHHLFELPASRLPIKLGWWGLEHRLSCADRKMHSHGSIPPPFGTCSPLSG